MRTRKRILDANTICHPVPQLRAFRDEAEAEARSEPAPPPPSPATLSLRNLRDDEVSFVRATAAAWRLGHALEDGDGGGGGGEGKGVRVWLPPVRLNSTHDVAAGMSVAPESAVGDDDAGGGVGVAGAGGEGEGGGEGSDGFDAGEFRCRVCYAVLPSGVLTVESDVSMPEHWPTIPRCVACGGCSGRGREGRGRFLVRRRCGEGQTSLSLCGALAHTRPPSTMLRLLVAPSTRRT